jgi:hypothetical protein
VTEPPAEPGACPSCGHALKEGLQFCTHCGKAATVVEGPVQEAAPVPAPAAPSEPPAPQWSLGTPPANERWWHNPIVIGATVVTLLLGGGGVASWRFFATSSETASVIRGLAANSPTGHPTTTTVPEPAVDLSVPVLQIQRVLVSSAAGRVAALQRHDYSAALRNRRRLMVALAAVEVPVQPERLAQAYATLQAAIRASAHADEQHLACGCDSLESGDVTASQLKRRFAIEFDPYARRYLGGPVDPNRI